VRVYLHATYKECPGKRYFARIRLQIVRNCFNKTRRPVPCVPTSSVRLDHPLFQWHVYVRMYVCIYYYVQWRLREIEQRWPYMRAHKGEGVIKRNICFKTIVNLIPRILIIAQFYWDPFMKFNKIYYIFR
jgi:hypothetical protein